MTSYSSSSRKNKFSKQDSDKPKKLQPAKQYMLWLLTRRDYSEKELRTKLTQKGYEVADIDSALTLCQDYGFQCDSRFAESKARNDSRRMGNRNITARLAMKGIDKELASAQLEALEPEEVRVKRVVEKFKGKPLDDDLRNKVWRHLSYRGFSSTAIKEAWQHLAALQDEEAAP